MSWLIKIGTQLYAGASKLKDLWILTTGFWRDTGIWEDTDVWKD